VAPVASAIDGDRDGGCEALSAVAGTVDDERMCAPDAPASSDDGSVGKGFSLDTNGPGARWLLAADEPMANVAPLRAVLSPPLADAAACVLNCPSDGGIGRGPAGGAGEFAVRRRAGALSAVASDEARVVACEAIAGVFSMG
jgi:hypothetical protein